MPADREVLDKVGALERIAQSQGLPLAAPSIQFPLQNPIVASVLLGTAKPSSLTRNMELTEPRLQPDDFKAYDVHTLVAPELGTDAVRV